MNTFKITIDGRMAEVFAGQTVLQAARQIGLDIPTLCHLEKCGPLTSCQVCLVKVVANGQGRLTPSCATPVRRGLFIEQSYQGQLYGLVRMFVDLPASVKSLAKSGPNPIQPAEVLERLREMVVSLQGSRNHHLAESAAD